MSTQAFVDLINACKESNHQIGELIPEYTQTMQLWVFQPSSGEHARIFFDVNWVDIQAYINGGITAEVFTERVRNFVPPAPLEP